MWFRLSLMRNKIAGKQSPSQWFQARDLCRDAWIIQLDFWCQMNLCVLCCWQCSLSFSSSPPIPLWFDGKYVISILSVFPLFFSVRGHLVIAAHKVVMDTLHTRFSLPSGSTILSGTILQAHCLLMSLIMTSIFFNTKIP